MANDISIDDIIKTRQEAQPGFRKGGQPLTPFDNVKDVKDFVNRVGLPDDYRTSIIAAHNKAKAIENDGSNDRYGQFESDLMRDEGLPSNWIGAEKPRSVTYGVRTDPHSDTVEVMESTEEFGDGAVKTYPAGTSLKDRAAYAAENSKDEEAIKASDPEGEKKTESEEEITEDEVKEADTPKGKEDVRVGTEEAAAREDKAKAIEALGKAKDDEERAEETVAEGPGTVDEYEDGISEDEIQSKLVRPDIDSQIAMRQVAGAEPTQQGFKVISIDGNEAVCETANGVRFKVPVW